MAVIEAAMRRMDSAAATREANPRRLREKLCAVLKEWAFSNRGLVQMDAFQTSIWNRVADRFRFSISIIPDLEETGKISIDGWVLAAEGAPAASVRLVLDTRARLRTKCTRRRRDVPLFFPNCAGARECGFRFDSLEALEAHTGRLEVETRDRKWLPLAVIDFSAAMTIRCVLDVQKISRSMLFDPEWYAAQAKVEGADETHLIHHFLLEGAANCLSPNPLFDIGYWFCEGRHAGNADRNPLLSYIERKPGDGQMPCRGFEPEEYLKRSAEAVASGLDPLLHFIQCGRAKKRKTRSGSEGSADPRGWWYSQGVGAHWVFEIPIPDNDRKVNLLLVGHALGAKLYGSERSLLELIQTIDRERFNIFCVFPQLNQQFVEELRPYVRGVAVFPFRWWNGNAEESDGFVGAFEAILKSRRIGLVHANTIMLRDPHLAARRLGIPCIAHLREIPSHDEALTAEIGICPEEITAEVIHRSDFLVSNSHFTHSQYPKPGRSFVLYNTADEDLFDYPPRPRVGPLRVVMMSSNMPKKGVADFFALARLALGRGAPLEFWLVGKQTPCVLEEINAPGGCPENVKLHPYSERPEEIIREIDVAVNLSNFAESFGRTIAEAMLSRRPAVVYRYGALPELIEDGVDGFIVSYREPEKVLEKLLELANDPGLYARMAENARTTAVGRFSRDAGRAAIARIYEAVLESPVGKAHVERKGREEAEASAKPMPRIAYCLWHFPVPSETFVLNELRELVRRGCDCRVYCRKSPHPEFHPDFPIQWEQVASVEELAAKLRESKREIVHAHFAFPTVTNWVWPACEAAGIPFTFIGHGQDVFRYANIQENRLAEIVRSPFCRGLFTLGSFHQRIYLEGGVPSQKLISRPQSVPVMSFEAQSLEHRMRTPRMSICAVNRFVEKKGMEVAIRAMGQLASHGISLHIYGYGPLEESLKALSTELGLANVHFPGPVNGREHLGKVLRKHDLLVAPSVRAVDGDLDGIPTCLFEAMASHVPVVASRLSSIPDWVHEGVTGYLCEPGDSLSFADAVLRFYNDPVAKVEAMALAARESILRLDVELACRSLLRVWSGTGIDIILVTYNNPAEVREVIGRIYRFTHTPFRLIIVDNGSDSETLDYLQSVAQEQSNVTLLPQSENLFVGHGTNKGLEVGIAPVAVYLCSREGYILSQGWDQAILDYMEDNPEVGLAGTLTYSPTYLTGADYISKLELFPKFRNREFAEARRDRIFHHVQGGLVVIRRAMYEAIGGFNEATPHAYTDVEYSYYAESCGWKLGEIPELVVLYNKTRPGITARITEKVMAVHPGSLELSPVLDAMVAHKTHLCNVCGAPVAYPCSPDEPVCPACGSEPFHRTLMSYIAASTLSYRGLACLFIGPDGCLPQDWKKMFTGRTVSYEALFVEFVEKGRIGHGTERFDLIILRVPCSVLTVSTGFLAELHRILKPDGQLCYHRDYGRQSLLEIARSQAVPTTARELAEELAANRFHTESFIRYSSEAVRFSECAMLVCQKI